MITTSAVITSTRMPIRQRRQNRVGRRHSADAAVMSFKLTHNLTLRRRGEAREHAQCANE